MMQLIFFFFNLKLFLGLADHDNYHEFCRLLGRFKVNYQVLYISFFFRVFISFCICIELNSQVHMCFVILSISRLFLF